MTLYRHSTFESQSNPKGTRWNHLKRESEIIAGSNLLEKFGAGVQDVCKSHVEEEVVV